MAKGPVDLSRPRIAKLIAEDGVRWKQKKVRWTFFPPNRPTRHLCRGDLEAWASRDSSAEKQKGSSPPGLTLFVFLRKMGLEPTQACAHKILSLARLPVPTLPLTAPDRLSPHGTSDILPFRKTKVNTQSESILEKSLNAHNIFHDTTIS